MVVVVGPVTWLAFGMVSGISSLISEPYAGQLVVPPPPDAVKAFGESLHELWSLAASNVGAAVTKVTAFSPACVDMRRD